MPFPIDIRTIFLVFSISNILIALFLFAFIKITKTSDKILSIYIIPKSLYSLAFLLYGLRDIISESLSILTANALLLFAISLEAFCANNVSQPLRYKKLKFQLLSTLILSIVFSLFVGAHYNTRVIVNSFILMIIYIQGGLPLLKLNTRFSLKHAAGIIYAIVSLLLLYRAINVLFTHSSSSLLQPSTTQLVAIFSVYLVSIFITFLIFLISKEGDSLQLIEQNKKIEADNHLLKKLNGTKNKFLSIISHDLRGPLGNIESLSFLLQDHNDELSQDEQNKYLKVIQNSASQANRLLNNLLYWSLSESDTIRYSPKEFALQKIIDESISLLSPLAVRKHILIHKQMDGNPYVYSDLEMMNTVIRNLINNAIKYSHPNTSISINSSYHNNDMVKVDVIDKGVGMSTTQINNIFESPLLHTSKGTCNESGSGLGLKLCIEFIERNGGKLGIDSKPGNGSCIWFTLPLAHNRSTS